MGPRPRVPLLTPADSEPQESRAAGSTAASLAEEEALVSALRRGEAEAYERLVRTHAPRMLAVARRYLKNEEDARDAVQEAFASAFRAMERFEGGSKLSTWLHRIVLNASLMRLRSQRRKPEESIEELLPRFLEDGHLERPTSGWRAGADHLMESAETRTAVRRAIEALPDSHRAVILLRDIEGFDTQETARELGISLDAVRTRLHRARLALRELLEPHFRRSE